MSTNVCLLVRSIFSTNNVRSFVEYFTRRRSIELKCKKKTAWKRFSMHNSFLLLFLSNKRMNELKWKYPKNEHRNVCCSLTPLWTGFSEICTHKKVCSFILEDKMFLQWCALIQLILNLFLHIHFNCKINPKNKFLTILSPLDVIIRVRF